MIYETRLYLLCQFIPYPLPTLRRVDSFIIRWPVKKGDDVKHVRIGVLHRDEVVLWDSLSLGNQYKHIGRKRKGYTYSPPFRLSHQLYPSNYKLEARTNHIDGTPDDQTVER